MAVWHSRRGQYLLMPMMLTLTSVTPPQGNPPSMPALNGASLVAASQKPKAGLPKPEPLEFAAITADRARLVNATTPFAGILGSPRAFGFTGSPDSRQRAIDCLASAMWYEAGNDAPGQRAVAQVVLNRVRHPAFPASVCGVVFQGSERRTGCQFTFTCDGSLGRVPSPIAFARARAEATAMLDGSVDRAVGLATHYHTDWVSPKWSAAMNKIARVDTHLFFRWRGQGGEAKAMGQRYSGEEPAIAALARISPIHRIATVGQSAPPIGDESASQQPIAIALAPTLSLPAPTAKAPEGVFQLDVVPAGNGGTSALSALKLCGDRGFCKVVGRVSGPDAGKVAFLYVRDRRTGVDRVFWDCDTFRRGNPAQCLSDENRSWINFEGNLQTARFRK